MLSRGNWLNVGVGLIIFIASANFASAQSSAGGQSMATYSYQGHTITTEQGKAMQIFGQAAEPMRSAHWEQALVIAKQALELYPDYVPALICAGLSCDQLRQYNEGISYLQHAVQLSPGSVEAWIDLGSGYESAGRFPEAVKTYNEYLKRFPSDSHVRQVQSLAKQLQLEAQRQAEVNKSSKDAANSGDDSSDYFAYSVPYSIMKWSSDRFPLKVYVPADEQAQLIPGYRPELGAVLRNAFKGWADKSNGVVSYTFVDQPRGSDIECRWVSDASQVRTPAEGGDAQIVSNVKEGINHVKITLLTRIPTSADPVITAATINTTALHEVGHSLGIVGHSPNPDDIMFAAIAQVSEPRGLSARDASTLAHLYRSNIKVGGQWQTSTGDPRTDLSNEAVNLMAANDYAGAAKKLAAVLKIDPDYQVAQINLAVCLTNTAIEKAQHGQSDEALAQYKQALHYLQFDSDNRRKATVMNNLASLLYNMNRTAEADEMKAAANKLLQ